MIKFCDQFLKITLGMIFMFLAIVSFITTQVCYVDGTEEFSYIPIYKIYDNIFLHIISIVIFCVIVSILGLLCKKTSFFTPKRILIFQAVVSVISGILTFMVYQGGMRTPYGDQAQVYNAAICFNSNDYTYFTPGGYLDMYPHQLGYVFLLQVIFKLTGSQDFRLIQILNCVIVSCIVFSSCILINDFLKKAYLKILGALLLILYFPLDFFATFVYGDLPSLLFCILAIHHFINALKDQNKMQWTLCILNLCLSVLLKKNNLILAIAMAIVLIIQAITNHSIKYMINILCILLLPVMSISAVNSYYSHVSRHELSGGLPAISWIAMGTIEEGCPGWFSNYPAPVYYESNFNQDMTKQKSLEKISERLSYFKNNPVYCVSFYKRKICTQWNDPLYHSDELIPVDEGVTAIGITSFIINNLIPIRTFLSLTQNIAYLGILFYLIFHKHTNDFYFTLPEIFILGGFLFSIIWEANSRFIITYYIVALPLMLTGWHNFLNKILHKYSKDIL